MNKKITIIIITILLLIIIGLSFALYKTQIPNTYLIAKENAEDTSSVHTVLYVFQDNKCVAEFATSKFTNEEPFNDMYESLSKNDIKITNNNNTEKILQFELTTEIGLTIEEIKEFYQNNWEFIEI